MNKTWLLAGAGVLGVGATAWMRRDGGVFRG